ncbi:MAG: PilZ domain-containing protein [Paenibacillaceae bacterium]
MAENQSSGNKDYVFQETNEPNMSILVHCRTVVEKKDYVSTGILTYAEGDMVEIEIGDYHVFDLGNIVKLTIYTPAGIFMFNTTVIAKDEGFLILINPPENRRKFSEKRKEMRVEVERHGALYGHWLQGDQEKKIFSQPIKVLVSNISQTGIGFIMQSNLKLNQGEHVDIAVDIGVKLTCKAEIKRMDETAAGTLYGGEIKDISAEHNKALRAFVLKSQVLHRSTHKKVDTQTQKRVFK